MAAISCPEYRLRVFMSVDLSGSTAYKANNGSIDPSSSPKPVWVRDMEDFYREFPATLAAQYKRHVSSQKVTYEGSLPKTWKRVGDEIIFCARLTCLEHLSACVLAFRDSLQEYGSVLESSNKKLDVKGYAWVAAFPSPNVTVFTDSEHDIDGEVHELEVDTDPGKYDFLGRDIDTGFRTSRFCSPSKLTFSLELSYLLAECAREELLSGLQFLFDGRHVLKGVIAEEPYPVFYVDVERKRSRKELRQTEAKLFQTETIVMPQDLSGYITAFIREVDLELPVLLRWKSQDTPQLPKSYTEYQVSWAAISKEIAKRVDNEVQSAGEDGHESLPGEVADAATESLSAMTESPTSSPSSPEGRS